MKRALLTFLCLLLPISACSSTNVELLMEQYLWQKRVILLFAPSAESSEFEKQNALLTSAHTELEKRDIVVWRIIQNEAVSVNGEHKVQFGTPPFYDYFDVPSSSATLILLGKDGGEKLRKAMPVGAESLFSLIDAMPMRQREIQEAR